jgi:hypothetical protein
MIEYRVDGTENSTTWYNLEGKKHRENGPAIEYKGGDKSYYINDKLHREDGPAIECSNGDKEYYINGKRHREDGPAIEYTDGYKSYYINGERHREGGPAVEYKNGYKAYYIKGKLLTEEQFNNRTTKTTTKIKTIMMSLYDYLGKAAGPDLGKKVYAYSKIRKEEKEMRVIQNPKFTGEVFIYRKEFLDEYFKVEKIFQY